jgi:hypothetical protein
MYHISLPASLNSAIKSRSYSSYSINHRTIATMFFHSHDLEGKGALNSDIQVEDAVKELASDDHALAFTVKEQKRIVRRVDRRLVVTLGCLYCISLLDRTNFGAASVAGYMNSPYLK